MKKNLTLFSILVLTCSQVYSQLNKNTWLIGGNGSYRSSKYEAPSGTFSRQVLVQLSGNIGYFLIDKFAIGIKPGYGRTEVKDYVDKLINNSYQLGPFVRYYFLQKDKPVNIFSELSYQYGITKTNQGISQNSKNFSGNGGCAVFFNSSVALEFTLGYSSYLYNNNIGKVKSVLAGIGFQFHLEK